jgi:uncharacterized protein (TIGR02145 family)
MKDSFIYMFNIVFILLFVAIGPSCKTKGTVTDVDGHVYKTVTIGNQVWMAENLRVTHFRNGEPIIKVDKAMDWISATNGAYCLYMNDTSFNGFGLLYNWYAVNDSRGLAPKGWHIPSIDEVKQLVDFIGGDTIAGDVLKNPETGVWKNANIRYLGLTGFNAIPCGYRDPYLGEFHANGYNGYWWTTTESFEIYAWSQRIFNSYANVQRENQQKNCGLSIRCVKD